MDWKREIKLSDLLKRGPKEAAAASEPVAAEPVAAGPARERKTLLKREISFRRRNRDSAEAVEAPKAPKRSKPPKAPRGRKSAPSLPDVPLMRAFDLLPKDDARRTARRPSTAQLALAVAGLVVVAGLASFFLIANARVADKEREYQRLREQLAARAVPAEQPQAQAGGENAALVQERQGRTTALATALGQRVAWDRILREFSLVLPEDVWLKSLKAASAPPPTAAPAEGAPPPADASASGKNTFEINGYARDQEGIAELLTRLAIVPEIETAQLVSATKVELHGENVLEFTVTAVVKPRQAGGNA